MDMLKMKNRTALTLLCTLSIGFSGCSSEISNPAPSIGGNVSGLNPGNTLVLKSVKSYSSGWQLDTITISSNGTYRFAEPIAEGESSYLVEVATQPGDQFCSLANAWGGSWDTTNVNVSCGNKVTAASSMASPRIDHTATLLANGMVLVAGGRLASNYALFSSELYDPATNTWAAAGSLPSGRFGHTANLLANGKVLVAGGANGPGMETNGAELYDPATDTWAPAPTSMASARSGHVSVVLADGRVLVAGGSFSLSPVASAEIYDPATGFWSPAGSLTLNTANKVKSAALLANGKVLVTKGQSTTGSTSGAAEIYDPVLNSWSTTAEASSLADSAAPLTTGDALVSSYSGTMVYATATNTWSALSGWPALPWSTTSANKFVLLADGTVLGLGQDLWLIYNATDSEWYQGPNLITPRNAPTATLLPNGKVLIAGGSSADGSGTILSSAELY